MAASFHYADKGFDYHEDRCEEEVLWILQAAGDGNDHSGKPYAWVDRKVLAVQFGTHGVNAFNCRLG